MSSKILAKKTNAGTDYSVAEENQSITYTITKGHSSGLIDGENEYWNVYIPASEIKKKCFPLNANPRQPNSIGANESTDIVVKMKKTLKTQPRSFVRLNNGFTCVCKSLTPNDKDNPTEIEVNWGEGEGILNGGHTYLSIQSVPPLHNADVRVEFIVLSNKLSSDPDKKRDFIKDTAIARNSNRQLEKFTQAEFEGKHDILKSHLGTLQSSIYFSEGFEDLNEKLDEKSALKAALYVSYLSTLDRSWHWHPSLKSNPKGKDLVSTLLVSGSKAYKDWLIVSLDDENEMNLTNVAPLGPVLLRLLDEIRESMRKVQSPTSGKTTKPIGYGNKFTEGDMFQEWAGAGQKSKTSLSYYDSSGTSKAIQIPKSSPHYINWILNSIRPFVWFGEADHDVKEFVGWYSDPLEVYEIIHKLMIKKTLSDFKKFKKYGSFVTHESTAKTVWDEVIQPIWITKCSTDSKEENFFPMVFFNPFDEKWYQKKTSGTHYLIFNNSEKEWKLGKDLAKIDNDEEVFRNYESISQPY